MHSHDDDTYTMPDRLPLYGVDGATLIAVVDEHRARELLKLGVVTVLRTKKKIRALRARERARVVAIASNSKFNLSHRKRQVAQPHRSETEDNPPRVWTIDRIPIRPDENSWGIADLFEFTVTGRRDAA